MDYNKTTKRQKTEKYNKLKVAKERLVNGYYDEFGNKVYPDAYVTSFIKWQELPYTERCVCYSEWDSYYEKVRDTRAHALFQEIREAFKSNQMAKLKELTKESESMRKEQVESGRLELPKPNYLNPYDFLHQSSVMRYQQLCKDTASMEEESKSLEINNIF